MTEPEIYAALTEIFRELFNRDNMVLTPELSAKDVKGWDSFRQVEIVLATEEWFGIKLHARDLDRQRNVGDLAAVIARKLGG